MVLKAMAQLTYYGKQAVESSQRTATKDAKDGYASVNGSTMMKPWNPYNEQLILGYMEDDQIIVSSFRWFEFCTWKRNVLTMGFYYSGMMMGSHNFRETLQQSAWVLRPRCTYG